MCFVSYQPEIEVMARALLLPEGQSSSKLNEFCQNSFLCGCRAEVPIFFLLFVRNYSQLFDDAGVSQHTHSALKTWQLSLSSMPVGEHV